MKIYNKSIKEPKKKHERQKHNKMFEENKLLKNQLQLIKKENKHLTSIVAAQSNVAEKEINTKKILPIR